jgi:hypothetical protein
MCQYFLMQAYPKIKRGIGLSLNEKMPPYRNRLDGMIKKLEL